MAKRFSNATKTEVWRRIDEKCRDCIYDSAEPGNWVQQIEACEIDACSLWAIRRISTAMPRAVEQAA